MTSKRFLSLVGLLLTVPWLAKAQTNINTGKPDAPWKDWGDNPLSITLEVQGTNIYAGADTPVNITLADAAIEQMGLGCNTNTYSEGQPAHLRLNHLYTLTVTGSNVSSFEVDVNLCPALALINTARLSRLFPQTSRMNGSGAGGGNYLPQSFARTMQLNGSGAGSLVGGANSLSQCFLKTYAILINGVDTTSVSGSTNCTAYSNSWTIQVISPVQQQPVNRSTGVLKDANFPDSAPGDGAWARIGPGKSQLANYCAIDWSVSLGHLLDGNPAVRLYIREQTLSSNIYTPSVLFYAAKSTNIQNLLTFVISDPVLGTLRQIAAEQAFVDIVPTNYAFDIRFYKPANVGPQTNALGVFTNITGSPFVTWHIQNPDQNYNISNRLYIVEDRTSYTATNQIVYNSTNSAWTLTQGSGAAQRVETRTISSTSSTNRTESVQIQYAGGAADYQETESYQVLGGDWQIVQAVEDPSGAALTTSFTYVSNGSPLDDGQIQSVTYPDGSWERRWHDPYSGALQYLEQPWMDTPSTPQNADYSSNGKVTTYGFGGTAQYPQQYSGIGLGGDGSSYFQQNLDCAFPYGDGTELIYSGYHDISEDGLYGIYSILSYTVLFTPDAGAPFDGHTIFSIASGHTEAVDFYYYDVGAYTSANHTFTVTTNGSDWQTTLIHGSQGWLSSGGRDINGGDAYGSIGGHVVPIDDARGNFDFYLYKNMTTKEVTMMHGGTIVEKDTYVYTGGDCDTNAQFSLLEQSFYTPDSIGHTTNIIRYDPVSGVSRTIYQADWRGANAYDTDLKFSETDEYGMQVVYAYDSLKSIATITTNGTSGGAFPAQPSTVTSTLYNSRGQTLSAVTTAGGLSLGDSWSYDLSGRLTQFVDTNGLSTSTAYQNGGRTITITHPDGGTEMDDHYLDGQLKTKTGTAVVPEYHSYCVEPCCCRCGVSMPTQYGDNSYVPQLDFVQYGSTNSSRWVTNGYDVEGRQVLLRRPDFSPGGVFDITWSYGYFDLFYAWTNGFPLFSYSYDIFDRPCAQGSAKENAQRPFPASLDRYQTNSSGYQLTNGAWCYITTNQTYLIDHDGTPTTLRACFKKGKYWFKPGGAASVQSS